MVRTDGYRLAVSLVVALAGLSAGAQVAPSPAVPGDGSQPWNAQTAPPPPRPPETDSTLSIRVYGDAPSRAPLPYRPDAPGLREPAYAVDVSAVMTRCGDGRLVITALVIGGQLTPLDNSCSAPPGGGSTGTPECDARTWNCTTGPAR